MKTILLFLLTIVASLSASAQGLAGSKLSSPHQSPKDRQAVMAVLQKQMAHSAASKTTQIKKRLVGYSYEANGVMSDTSHFYYSGIRGSHHSDIYSFFDYYQPQSIIINFGSQFVTEQSIQSDSSMSWSVDPNGDLELLHKKAYEYNSDNKVINCLDSNTAWYYVRNVLDYDASGRLSSFISFDTFGGTQLIAKSRTFVLYNSLGQRIADSTIIIPGNIPAYRADYTYDANGNLTMFANSGLQINVWEPLSQNIYTYDNNNRLVSYVSQYYYLGDLYNNWKDSFEYSGNNTQFSLMLSYYFNDQINDWYPTYKEADHVNTQGQVDTYYLYNWDGSAFDTVEKDYLVYDGDGLALYSHAFHYLGNGVYETTPYDMQTWYYEEYNDPTSVPAVASTGQLDIYPNPASGSLSVRSQSKDAIISVLDMEGRMLYDGTLNKNGSLDIDLQNYAPGSYFVITRSQQGRMLEYRKFIRL
jgi:hypothetical protein